MQKRIEGIFLSFTPQEQTQLTAALERLGYEFSIEGIKAFLFDCAINRSREKRLDRFVNEMERQMREHPQQVLNTVNNLADSAIGFFDMLTRRK